MTSFFSWFTSNNANSASDNSDILKNLIESQNLPQNEKINNRSHSASECVLTEQTATIPVYTDNFTNPNVPQTSRKRFSFISRRKRSTSIDLVRKLSTSSSDSEYSNRIKTNTKRFRSIKSWKLVFESKKKEEGDKLEGFMVKKFINLAKTKLKQKLMLEMLEKLSITLSLVEKQVSSDEKLVLFANSLNGYILCTRFSYAKILNKNLKFQKTKFNLSFSNLREFILSSNEINKKLTILNKLNSKKQKKTKILADLKKQAVEGIYLSFALFLLSLKKETTSTELSEYIINTVFTNIDILIENNKDLIISNIKQFIDINNSFIVSILDNQVESIIKYLKLTVKKVLNVIKEHHLVPFFKLLEENGVFKKKWKIDSKTREIVLDEHDKEMINQLEISLNKMYIQSEFFIHCFTTVLLKHIEQLLS